MTPPLFLDPDTGLAAPDPGGPLRLWSEPVPPIGHSGMTWEAWLEAVIAAPGDAATRMAFLDWLQELDPERYGPHHRWWSDYSADDGRWAVETLELMHPDGILRPWTILLWDRGPDHLASGVAVVQGRHRVLCTSREPREHGECRDDKRLIRVDGRWLCPACYREATGYTMFGGLYPAHGHPQGELQGRMFDDIPF